MMPEITENVVMEIVSHEAIVREAYKDSANVWTWGIGVTNASGHEVYPRYKDNQQTLDKCVEIFVWLLNKQYGPDVTSAFGGMILSDSEFAAALSFHYNTGAIGRATWVRNYLNGEKYLAYKNMLNWHRPAEVIPRREKERKLFFDGVWSHRGYATEYKIDHSTYRPNWDSAKFVDIKSAVRQALRK